MCVRATGRERHISLPFAPVTPGLFAGGRLNPQLTGHAAAYSRDASPRYEPEACAPLSRTGATPRASCEQAHRQAQVGRDFGLREALPRSPPPLRSRRRDFARVAASARTGIRRDDQRFLHAVVHVGRKLHRRRTPSPSGRRAVHRPLRARLRSFAFCRLVKRTICKSARAGRCRARTKAVAARGAAPLTSRARFGRALSVAAAQFSQRPHPALMQRGC